MVIICHICPIPQLVKPPTGVIICLLQWVVGVYRIKIKLIIIIQLCSRISKTYSCIFNFVSGNFYWGHIGVLRVCVPVMMALNHQNLSVALIGANITTEKPQEQKIQETNKKEEYNNVGVLDVTSVPVPVENLRPASVDDTKLAILENNCESTITAFFGSP